MESTPAPAKKSRLTLYIVIALVLGIVVGFVLNKTYLNEANQSITEADAAIREISANIATEKDSAKLAGYTQVKKELNQVRNAALSSRDEKVEPFSLLADI